MIEFILPHDFNLDWDSFTRKKFRDKKFLGIIWQNSSLSPIAIQTFIQPESHLLWSRLSVSLPMALPHPAPFCAALESRHPDSRTSVGSWPFRSHTATETAARRPMPNSEVATKFPLQNRPLTAVYESQAEVFSCSRGQLLDTFCSMVLPDVSVEPDVSPRAGRWARWAVADGGWRCRSRGTGRWGWAEIEEFGVRHKVYSGKIGAVRSEKSLFSAVLLDVTYTKLKSQSLPNINTKNK